MIPRASRARSARADVLAARIGVAEKFYLLLAFRHLPGA